MENKKKYKVMLMSGGFDPVHRGHIECIQRGLELADEVWIGLNNEQWLRNKKGKEFLSFDERKIIMQNIKGVLDVLDFDDSDQSCVNGILKAKNMFKNNIIKFANGGDRNNKTTPEKEFCDSNNIETLFGIGGINKSNSSSLILKK